MQVIYLIYRKYTSDFFFVILREKYKELLSNFNELQSETASLQQLVESGSLNAKTIEADFKVWVIQWNSSHPFYTICNNSWLIVLTIPLQIILSNKESEEKAFKLRGEIQKLENENRRLRLV